MGLGKGMSLIGLAGELRVRVGWKPEELSFMIWLRENISSSLLPDTDYLS
jgi:hypothetical protein